MPPSPSPGGTAVVAVLVAAAVAAVVAAVGVVASMVCPRCFGGRCRLLLGGLRRLGGVAVFFVD